MPYWRLNYHATWTCKDRQPLITPELEPELYKYLAGKGMSLGAIMHEVGGIATHVHTVFSLPPKIAVANFIGKLKGASSHWVTHVLKHPHDFQWQRGYGVVSFSTRHLSSVIDYVRNQKTHHQQQTVRPALEESCDDDDGPAPPAGV